MTRTHLLSVSILVFLELALRQVPAGTSARLEYCFNPCFPGTRSSTPTGTRRVAGRWRRFNPCFPGTRSSTYVFVSERGRYVPRVSILVFLELALRQQFFSRKHEPGEGFNPCFPGTRSSTAHCASERGDGGSFNPCFPGTRSSTQRITPIASWVDDVSILVFLELALRPCKAR